MVAFGNLNYTNNLKNLDFLKIYHADHDKRNSISISVFDKTGNILGTFSLLNTYILSPYSQPKIAYLTEDDTSKMYKVFFFLYLLMNW